MAGVKYVEFQRDENAQWPMRAHAGDAGMDLFTSEEVTIQPDETSNVHTGIRIAMPPRMYARIVGRSSSLRKHALMVNEGVIDNGYTGELFVCVRNLNKEPVTITKGMRVAQILFHVIEDVRLVEIDDMDSRKSERGNAGFGSTGV